MTGSNSHRSHSSPSHSRASSALYLPGGADVLVIRDGPIGKPATEFLGDTIHDEAEPTTSSFVGDSASQPGRKAPANSGELPENNGNECIEDDEEEQQERQEREKRPFYRRPSPWWMLITTPMIAIAMSTTIAPRVEIYTKLVCHVLKPGYTVENLGDLSLWAMPKTIPPPSKMCGRDPDVQAAVAKLVTFMTVSMGILSSLTTGWWGQFSDRHGRIRMLGIAVFGLLMTDFNFILVSLASDRLPGGYGFFLVGPIIDGLLGGMTAALAGIHAYVSDCTPPEARARIFSLNLGLLFGGMALGPTLGGLLVRVTNDLLSVFYLATASQLFYMCLICFIIPESLTKASMERARQRRKASQADIAVDLVANQDCRAAVRTRMWGFFRALFGFSAPLSIFLPSKRPEGGRDWNLTLLVFGIVCVGLLTGSNQFKFQYAQKVFGWDSEAMGYWLTVVGIVQAVHLVVILPLVTKIFTPKPVAIQLPVSPSEPLHPTRSSPASNGSPSRSLVRPKVPKHSPSFDIALARISLGIELVSYIGMTLALSSLSWTAATLFAALGGGVSPAMQSAALALYERGPNRGIETGRLFGGLSVVQALSAQIVGPSLFGFTYASTVKTFPKGIFIVAAGAVACSLFFMLLVQSSPPKVGHDGEAAAVRSTDGSE